MEEREQTEDDPREEVKLPDETVEDLEPEDDEAADVHGGAAAGWDLKSNKKV
jgi:hypothetical protein